VIGIRSSVTGWLRAWVITALAILGASLSAFGQDAAKDPAQVEAEQKQKFLEQLNKGKYAITLDAATGKTSGPGMGVLSDATVDAQFVLIGEDHGIREIPQFAGSVFEMLAPRGFHTLAIETGPNVTSVMQENVAKPDGAARMAEFVKRYPFSVAFYNWREEYAFLQRCARASDGKVNLWGLDQELMGSAGYLLKRISEQMLGPDARTMAAQLIKENDERYAAAAKTGDPSGLFMMTAKDAELSDFTNLLKTQGTPAAEKMMASLWESREIYKKFMEGQGFLSNRQRAQLLKKNFKHDYTTAGEDHAPPTKVMFKFGAYHMYRGLNLLNNNDIGNLVAELADWNGTKSVDIVILGVKGEEAAFGGIGRPSAKQPLDLRADKRGDFSFIEPLLDNMLRDSWTLFDLRALRSHFASYGKVDPELTRMIFGYDFLVLVPQTTASTDLE